MGFWNIVIDELEYQGKSRKWLAAEAKIDVSTIGTGLKRGSLPNVDLALRVAAALKVPVEYLATGKSPSSDSDSKQNPKTEDLHLFHKYANLITKLDSLPENERASVIHLVEEL